MALKYKITDNDHLYFVTFTVVFWIDIFIRKEFRDVFYQSTAYCIKNKGLTVYAYCIMTSHIHLIIGTDKNPLSEIIRDWKSYTSRHIRKNLEKAEFESRKKWILNMCRFKGLKNINNKDFQLWAQNNHPIQLDSYKKMEQRLDYIHNNPVEAGFVEQADHWLHSSAGFYFKEQESIIKLERII